MHDVSFRPVGPRLLIKREKASSRAGHLYIPEKAQEKPQWAEVVALGQLPRREDGTLQNWPHGIEPGAAVLFGKYTGNSIKLDDEDYIIIQLDDVLGVRL